METAKKETPAGAKRYVRADVEHLQTGQALGFDLYLGSKYGSKIRVWGGEDHFSPALKDQLTASGADVFVLESEHTNYLDYMEDRLKQLITDDRADDEETSSLAYELSLQVMERAFNQPDRPRLKRAEQAIIASAELIMASDKALLSLLSLARHDYYTYTHCCNVGLFSLGLIKQLIKDGQDHDVSNLGPAFFFHDLGKIEVGQAIINKPGKLTDEEWVQMRRHPKLGFDVLKRTGFLTDESDVVVMQHHERMDGRGYPDGLTGNEIHLYGRVCQIADVFDALTSERSYKSRMAAFDAAKIMTGDMAGQFDRELLKKFISMFLGV